MGVSARTRVELYYASRFGGEPQGTASASGRVVLLGEHVDHQGGRILAVPTREAVYVAWGIRPDRTIALHALNARATDRFEPDRPQRSGRRWSDLARGVCATFAAQGRRLPGLNLAVFGDLPTQVGLASSAAYVTALLKAVAEAISFPLAPPAIAKYAAAVERDWAGVHCGFMDPYVAAAGRPGEVVHLDNRTLRHDPLSLPEGCELTHRDTGIKRRLSETPYNERRRELAAAWEALHDLVPDATSLTDLAPDTFAAQEARIPEPGRRRARHVVTEAERVRRGVDALHAGDAAALGALMRACHESLTHDFECSTPEIDAQVEAARSEEGVIGVRLQGAGWGGSLAVLRRTT